MADAIDTARLRELLAKATPQNINTAESVEAGTYECPLCAGEGDVDGVTFTNYDGAALELVQMLVEAAYESDLRRAQPVLHPPEPPRT